MSQLFWCLLYLFSHVVTNCKLRKNDSACDLDVELLLFSTTLLSLVKDCHFDVSPVNYSDSLSCTKCYISQVKALSSVIIKTSVE